MKFEQALKAMREGKKVKHDNKIYFIKNNQLRYIRLDYETKILFFGHLNYNEILLEDWEVVGDDINRLEELENGK